MSSLRLALTLLALSSPAAPFCSPLLTTAAVLLAGGAGAQALADATPLNYALRETIPVSADGRVLAVRDMDGDGMLDIVMYDGYEGRLWILEREGALFVTRFTVDEGFRLRGTIVADVDDDGFPEMLWGERPGLMSMWEASGDNQYALVHTEDIGGGWAMENTAAGDSDGDGQREFLFALEGFPTRVVILEAVDGAYVNRGHMLGSFGNSHVAGTWDLDGDGAPETVFHDDGRGREGIWTLHVYEGGKQVFQQTQRSCESLGDTDGNGLGEMLGYDTSTGRTIILESTGSQNQFVEVYNAPADGYSPDHLVDADNDGRAEFWRATDGGSGVSNVLWLGARTGQTIAPRYMSDELLQDVSDDIENVFAIGDTNGDGRIELAVVQGSSVRILEQVPDTPVTLTVQAIGQGDVDPNGGTYDRWTEVTLTATPADGWHFVEWLGDLTGSDNPATLSMNTDKTVTAVFEENPPGQHALTVIVQGQGSVDPNSGTYDEGSELTLTATAADGWHFVEWLGDLMGSENPASVAMDADKNITAVFEQDPPIQYTLSTAVQGQGTVDPNSGTYDEGTQLALTATPADGWHFVEWLDDLAGSYNPATLFMNADKTVTAVFQENPPGQYALTVVVQGQGSVDPNGGTYDEGTELTLTATPADGWHFVEWSGDLTGSANPASVAMDGDKNITAVFEEDPSEQYALTVVVQGQGSVDPNGGTYDEGTRIPLAATPAEGWHFVEWLGDLTGSANPASVAMDGDKTITAVFEQDPPIQYTLSTAVQGQGSVDPNGGAYEEGSQLTLTATPADGWHFVQWLGDLTGSANPGPLTMDADKTITAVFQENPPGQYALTLIVEGQGSVDPNSGTYDEGTELTLTATAADGWHFVEWLGDLTGSANPASVAMDADKTITAVFEQDPPIQYTLSTAVQGQGSVDPNGGTYEEGSGLTLTATPADGWHFVQWLGDLTGSANPGPLTMDADKTVTAVFQENPPGQCALTLIVQGEGSVDPNGGTYDEGTELILTATPARGWRFVEWQGDMPGPANPARLRMNADKTITAVFVEDGSDGLGCWAMQGVLSLPFVGLLWVMLGRRRRASQ